MGSVIFASHQWTGLQRPDPSSQQFKVFQDALRGILDERLSIESVWATQLGGLKKEKFAAEMIEEIGRRAGSGTIACRRSRPAPRTRT